VRCRALLESSLIDAVNDVLWHGFGWRLEDRRLIHIVPEAINSVLMKPLIERAPPRTRLLTGKVRKYTGPRPDRSDIDRTIRRLYKVISGNSTVIRVILAPGQLGDMQIGNSHKMKVFRFELCGHRLEI